MAQVEPMDIDAIDSDFDNKENTFHHSNVLSRTPCTEKGYEELDVSELNMKLRYSITPAASPMSKSFTGPCLDNRSYDPGDENANSPAGVENGNLTRSLNSTLSKTESISKSSKLLPLQALSADQFVDSNRNANRWLLDPGSSEDKNVTVTVSGSHEIDENLSLPSTSSSVTHTPEATTPTKDIPKPDGSPIMRGLKSVLNMFRSSQSPIPPNDDKSTQDILSPMESHKTESEIQAVLASTPVAPHRSKDGSPSKRSSPLKDSVVFNDDLERELQWKDETTIIFKDEKIPVHKLFLQNPLTSEDLMPKNSAVEHLNSTVEYMDISCNDSAVADRTMTDIDPNTTSHTNINIAAAAVESDNEFLDCETTFTKNESYVSDYKDSEIGNKGDNIGNITIDLKEDSLLEVHKEDDNLSVKTVTSEQMSVTERFARTTEIIEATKCLLNGERTNETNFFDDNRTISQVYLDSTNNNESQPMTELDINLQVNLNHTMTKENNDVVKDSDNNIICEGVPILTESVKGIDETNVEKNIEQSDEIISEVINEPEHMDVTVNKSLDSIDTKEVNLQSPYKDVISKIGNFNDMHSQISNDSNGYNVVPDVLQDITIDKESVCDKTHVSVNNDSKSDVEKLNITSENSIHDDKHILEKNIESLLAEINNEAHQSSSTPILLDEVNINKSIKEMSNIENEIGNVVNSAINLEEKDLISTQLNESQDIISSIIKTDNEDKSVINQNNDLNNSNTLIVPNENDYTYNTEDIVESKDDPVVEGNTPNVTVPYEGDITNHSEMPPSITDTSMALIDNDREFSEVTVSNDMAFTKSPSDIPLPDEDDIEKENFETNMVFKNNEDTQDATFQINEDISMMQVENTDTLHMSVLESKLDQTIIKDLLVQDMEILNIDQNNPPIMQNIILDSSASNLIQASTEKITDNLNVQIVDSEIKAANIQAVIQEDMQNINNESVIMEPKNPDMTVPIPILEQGSLKCEVDINKDESNTIPSKESFGTNVAEVKCVENVCEAINMTIDIDNNAGVVDNSKTDNPSCVSPGVKSDNTFSIPQNGNANDNNMNIAEAPLNGDINEVSEDLKNEVDEMVEEIITSANNSPYVSVLDLAIDAEKTNTKDPIEETNDSLAGKSKIAPSPPLSPKIVSKGTYNFNFDDMEDPFATKTKIRVSPTPDTVQTQPSTAVLDNEKKPEISKKPNNRRKSQPERKRPPPKKNFNSTLSGPVNPKINVKKADTQQSNKNDTMNISSPKSTELTSDKIEEPNVVVSDVDNIVKTAEVKPVSELNSVPVVQREETQLDDAIKSTEGFAGTSIVKSTSSSEQYFSLGTSGDSVEPMHQSKNVFNLPEIDDINFNPFVTKSKMRLSPSPSLENVNKALNNTANNKTLDSSIKIPQETEINDITINVEIDPANQTFDKAVTKDISPNISTTTSSSKNTDDRNNTVREVLTEDEDTIEGPFLEAEDLTDVEKITDMDDENDMMHFNDLPPQEKDEHLENGELFIDADAFEFLLNQNKSNTVLDSGKESLFLKFDPLFAKRVSSDGVLAALQKVQKRQSTPKKLIKPTQKDFTHIEKPMAGPSSDKVNNVPMEDYNQDDQSSTTAKPMMVVNPAVSSIVSPRKSTTPPKINRRSLTFTSPAMAVIDRLLSLSGNTSLLNHDTSMPHAREHNETDLVITQLRELLAEKEIHVHNLRSESKELKDRLANLEVQVKTLETEGKDRLSKINELNERLTEKTKINKSMATVVEEYERTIASLIAETEQDKKRNAEERMRLIKERDEQTAHLASMEVSFSDLHSKYEKSKQIILSCKANEDTYKKSIKEFEDNFVKMQNNYELLKQHATSKLNHANQELEKMNRAHEAEVLKLNAMIKRKELHITSLEETLTQKTKANEELTAICDELINKVG